VVYLAGLLPHTADHVRRGAEVVTTEVRVGGLLTTLAGIVAVALIFRRHRRAPAVAALVGLSVAVLVTRTHLLPAGADAFPGSTGVGVTAFSWVAVLIEMVGLLSMGLFGLLALRQQRHAEHAKSGG
jgi:hypothetical protein